MTIILSNAMDEDCQILKETWQNVQGNFIEITPDMDVSDEWQTKVEEAIREETDTLVLLGHGTSFGLLFPIIERGEYIIHEHNVLDIKAKNIICVWCNASSFVSKFDELHNVLASSMFISNVNEAYYYGFTKYNQNTINKISRYCGQELVQLLMNEVPLKEWVMQIGSHADILNEIDMFNRQGFYYKM